MEKAEILRGGCRIAGVLVKSFQIVAGFLPALRGGQAKEAPGFRHVFWNTIPGGMPDAHLELAVGVAFGSEGLVVLQNGGGLVSLFLLGGAFGCGGCGGLAIGGGLARLLQLFQGVFGRAVQFEGLDGERGFFGLRMHESHVLSEGDRGAGGNGLVKSAEIGINDRSAGGGMLSAQFDVFNVPPGMIGDREMDGHDVREVILGPVPIRDANLSGCFLKVLLLGGRRAKSQVRCN